MSSFDTAVVDRIVEKHGNAGGTLIGVLTDIQKEFSYLPREAMLRVGERLGIPFSQVFAVSTFYKIFSLTPRGKHSIKVCLGTACHVKGAGLILDRLCRDLGIPEGGTTEDGRYTLETVRCVGCCSIAPVVMVDETAHGRVKQEELSRIIGSPRAVRPGRVKPAGRKATRQPSGGKR